MANSSFWPSVYVCLVTEIRLCLTGLEHRAQLITASHKSCVVEYERCSRLWGSATLVTVITATASCFTGSRGL